MTNSDHMLEKKLEKVYKFITEHVFRESPFQDGTLSQCTFCLKRAWLRQDVPHTRDCEVGKILNGLDKV